MMSLALVGGLLLAGPVSAQPSGRHRPATANGASSQSRSHESRSQSRASESSRSVRQAESRGSARSVEARPQTRSSETRQSSSGSIRNNRERPSAAMTDHRSSQRTEQTTRSATTADRRDRSGSGNYDRNRDNNRDRSGSGNYDRNRDNNRDRSGNYDRNRDNNRDRSGNYDRNRDNNRDRSGSGNYDRNRDNNRDRSGSGNYDRNRDNNRDRSGNYDRNRNDRNRNGYDYRSGSDRRRPGGSGRVHSSGPVRPHNYDRHPHRDHFRNNFARHNWSRPLPPPHRAWRPVVVHYYRPVVPAHYRPYYGAPVIDRILGITFGTYFDVSLDYLYSNGYYIDGYDANVVYLRDVSMLNLLWPDVMLSYDSGRLANAQFVYATGYNDRSRYNRIYHDLCGVYGPPVTVNAGVATWFGGNTTGWVTLSLGSSAGRFLTTLSIGY